MFWRRRNSEEEQNAKNIKVKYTSKPEDTSSPNNKHKIQHKIRHKKDGVYCTNEVRTTKYTIISFLPKNLYEQFRRVANIYFLAIACLQVLCILVGLSFVTRCS